MKRRWLAFLCCLVSMPLCARMLPGISASPVTGAVLAGAILGLMYLLLRPILRILTFPVGCLTLGLSGFAIDCALILALPRFVPGFTVEGVPWAALAALLINGMCLIVGGVK